MGVMSPLRPSWMIHERQPVWEPGDGDEPLEHHEEKENVAVVR